MNRKIRYRVFVLLCLVLDLVAIGWCGYRYFDRKIPDEIHVSRENCGNVQEVLGRTFLTFEDEVPVSVSGSYTLTCKLFGVIPFKEVKVTPTDNRSVFVSGSAVGIYMEMDGVLIIDTGEIISESGEPLEPAKNIVKSGDYIVAFNEEKVTDKQDLMHDLAKLDGGDVTLSIVRNGETVPVSVTPVKDSTGKYKLGIWVRDDTQGIGTLTFVDEKGNYGALGHGISDVDTGNLLDIRTGDLYQAEILGIQKGSKGSPGELSGMIRYEPARIMGTITCNSKRGIYGHLFSGFSEESGEISLRRMQVGYKQEVTTGPASILCCIDNEVREYDAQITQIDMNHKDSNKSFIIHVTDQELLEATGGIVQGMSGSPVIQNGKFVGAVTHVFVQDSTSGYGIFAETMLEAAK